MSCEELREPTLRESVVMDRVFAPHAFHELASIVEESTLSSSLPPIERREISDDEKLVRHLGANGLRFAFEVCNDDGITHPDHLDKVYQIITDPESLTDEIPSDVLEWAEAYGAALLDETFGCLGDDAPAKAEAYKNSQSANEQMEILKWLDERLNTMARKTKNITNDNVYHPARLSPKLIGRYPNTTLPPTCLGLEILSASFLRKAEAPMLHAGVMCTEYYNDLVRVAAYATAVGRRLYERAGDTDLVQLLDSWHSYTLDQLNRGHNGFHTATVTRLADGKWAIVDPNFSYTSYSSLDENNKKLDEVYAQLNDLADVAPNLMIGARFWSLTYPKDLISFDKDVELSCYEPSDNVRASIEQVLTDDEDESIPRQIAGVVMRIYDEIYGQYDDGLNTMIRDKLAYRGETCETCDKGMCGTVYGLIEKYVLREQSPIEMKELCRRDKNYLNRCVNDIVNAAAALRAAEANYLTSDSVLYSQRIVEEDDFRGGMHPSMELGRTEINIGLAVLSDFASVVAGDPLPPTFWHSAWTSLVPITETAHAAKTDAQRQAVAKMGEYLRYRGLTYATANCIVESDVSA